MSDHTNERAQAALARLNLGPGWQGVRGEELRIPWSELPSAWTEGSRAMEQHELPGQDELVAEVRVQLRGAARGESTVELWVAPDKALGAARTGTSAERIQALSLLREMINRELSDAYARWEREARQEPSR